MRVFLRTKKAGLYYRSSGELTAELGEALEFVSAAAAARFALSEKLPDAEITLRCDYLASEVSLPVTALWCDLGDEALPGGNPVPAASTFHFPLLPSATLSLRGDEPFPKRLA